MHDEQLLWAIYCNILLYTYVFAHLQSRNSLCDFFVCENCRKTIHKNYIYTHIYWSVIYKTNNNNNYFIHIFNACVYRKKRKEHMHHRDDATNIHQLESKNQLIWIFWNLMRAHLLLLMARGQMYILQAHISTSSPTFQRFYKFDLIVCFIYTRIYIRLMRVLYCSCTTTMMMICDAAGNTHDLKSIFICVISFPVELVHIPHTQD